MKVLDLFSGIGGFSVGLERAGMETIAFCEIEEYPKKVLAKNWPGIPIASDVKKLTYQDGVLYDDGKEIYRGPIDVVCGGFPCQDISNAGKQKGIEAERSGLWTECARLLREIRPKHAIFENVTALISGDQGRWFQRVLFDISQVGYDAEWHCIAASDIGAHHHRDRVWIMVYPNKTHATGECLSGRISEELSKSYGRSGNGGASENVANTNKDTLRIKQKPGAKCKSTAITTDNGKKQHVANTNSGRQSQPGALRKSSNTEKVESWQTAEHLNGCIGQNWETEPALGRVVDGVQDKSHRHQLAGLGNAVVPQIPEILGRVINER